MPDDPASMWWSVAWIVGLLLINVLVSVSHMAMVSLSDARLARLCDEKHKKALRVQKLLGRSVRFTESARLCNVLLGFAFAAVSFKTVYAPLLTALPSVWPTVAAKSLAAAVTVTAAVFVWMLITELLPRRFVVNNAETVSFAMVGFLSFMIALVTPFHVVMSGVANGFSRLFGVDPDATDDEVTEEEIRLLVDVGEEKGVIEETQKEMINNIFEFDDLTVADIMTPRIDVEAVEADDSIEELLTAAVDHGKSRFPVYEEDIDHVIGVLYIKDFLPYIGKPLPEEVTVRSMLRDAMFVPEAKKCVELFSEMTAAHIQMAMVVDEYGGIAGLVTMEDLLEAIVGNMQDEYDNELEEVTQLDEHHYTVEGSTDIEEVADLLDMEIPEGDYETLGGFLMSHIGRVPRADEHPVVHFKNAVFTVLSMDDRRIGRVHIEIIPVAEDEEKE